ncbi:hypothetical protein BVY02_02620, partial [bacterium J17]
MSIKTNHSDHQLGREHFHCLWDKEIPPTLFVEPGEVAEIETWEASGGKISKDSTTNDISKLNNDTANPVTGPIFVNGAEPGDLLEIEIIDFALSNWGRTAIIPGFGLLSEDFSDPYLLISLHDQKNVELFPNVIVPTVPFPGTIGLAPNTTAPQAMIPPMSFCGRSCGGNMDIPELTRGSKLYLPVEVAGALFSVGDTHAAQGSGEVCGTAIESPMKLQVRFDLQKSKDFYAPWAELPAPKMNNEILSIGSIMT